MPISDISWLRGHPCTPAHTLLHHTSCTSSSPNIHNYRRNVSVAALRRVKAQHGSQRTTAVEQQGALPAQRDSMVRALNGQWTTAHHRYQSLYLQELVSEAWMGLA